eukprot:5083285-Amphidinium_carterae.1
MMRLCLCIHKVGRLKVQRWLSKCFERWNRSLRLKWPKQGVDVIVDRCLRRLSWASKEVQPAATAAMLRVLGNGFPLPSRMGQSKECPLCEYKHAGSIQHIILECTWWHSLRKINKWRHLTHEHIINIVGNFWDRAEEQQAAIYRLTLMLGRILYEVSSRTRLRRHINVTDLVSGAVAS